MGAVWAQTCMRLRYGADQETRRRRDKILLTMKTLADCLEERGMSVNQLVRASGVDEKDVKAIVRGNYTPSPTQRQLLADAVGFPIDEIDWQHSVEVQHLWGHGPQFGRTP